MLARVRAATACCAAIVASRAACRAAFVVALLAIAHTLSPPKPLMPHPNPTTFPPPQRPCPFHHPPLPHQQCLVQLKIARNAPRLLEFAN
jgi:hypothetical protein